jgi:ATP-dependent DNA helicase PIF1
MFTLILIDNLNFLFIIFFCTDYVMSLDDLKEACLVEIDKYLGKNGKSLRDYECMPQLRDPKPGMFNNILLENEFQYDYAEMKSLHEEHVNNLNSDQIFAYQSIYNAIDNGLGTMFFVDGYGGTGKTFLWKTLTYRLRSEGKVVVNVASSGIASILLPGGRTAHSQFGIPLVLTKESCCTIDKKSKKAELLIMTSLIIWDEAPMINRWAFEAFERTLQDVMSEVDVANKKLPFGGKTIVFGGDFRQILPVIPRGSRADIVNATINSSYLWRRCKVLSLTKNMRLDFTSNSAGNDQLKEFAKWLLDIGDGKVEVMEDGDCIVEIPQDLLVQSSSDTIGDIVEKIYPNLLQNILTPNFFQDKAILAPTLEVVENINDYVLALMPGEIKEYLSCDSIQKCDDDVGVDYRWITTEFLNDIKCSGMPNHKLYLKIGAVVMLLRNIDISSGLCNGTRLIVTYMGTNVIGAEIATGTNIGDLVYIHRQNLVPSDANVSISFRRRQFPLSVCFGMTINKSQGQTLSYVGLYLPRPVFTHGQLYVAISRVKTRSGLKILITDDAGLTKSNTVNVVYPEVFQKIYN